MDIKIIKTPTQLKENIDASWDSNEPIFIKKEIDINQFVRTVDVAHKTTNNMRNLAEKLATCWDVVFSSETPKQLRKPSLTDPCQLRKKTRECLLKKRYTIANPTTNPSQN